MWPWLAELMMHLTISFAYGARQRPSYKNAAARIESLASVLKGQRHSRLSVIHSRRAKKPWPFHPRSTELIWGLLNPDCKVLSGPVNGARLGALGEGLSHNVLQPPVWESLGGRGVCYPHMFLDPRRDLWRLGLGPSPGLSFVLEQ